MRAEALGVPREIGRQIGRRLGVGVQSRPVSAGITELRPESGGAERARERPDRREAVIVDEHDDELGPLLQGRDDRLAQHEIRAVPDERVHLAVPRGQLHAQRARDLVAHARVAVLDVVLLAVTRPPELVKVARHRARSAHDDVHGRGRLVHGPDDLTLRGQRLVSDRVQPGHLRVPRAPELRGFLAIPALNAIVDLGERLESGARVRDDSDPGMLRRVELGDVRVDEAHRGVRERGLRPGGEVGPSRADPDHHIGIRGEPVRGQRPGRADRPHGLRVVERQRPLPGLCLSDGDSRPLDEGSQCIGGARVDDPATSDDERALRAADRRDGSAERRGIGRAPVDVPDPFGHELARVVVGLGLHVLGHRERDRAGICRAREDAHRGERGRDQLFGPADAVPVAGDRDERVVHRDVAARRYLDLLQHRVRHARREHVARQEQHRQPIHGRERRARDHVRRAGADRRRARERREPIVHAGEPARRMHHRLLVARHVIWQELRPLEEGLADIPPIPHPIREKWRQHSTDLHGELQRRDHESAARGPTAQCFRPGRVLRSA